MSPATTLEGWIAAVDQYSNEAIRGMFDKFIIMLCTCLKDTNGNEIYESDIVETTKDCPCKGAKNVVEWKNVGWHVGDGLLAFEIDDDDLLVVGNMWEQPELLGVRGQGGV